MAIGSFKLPNTAAAAVDADAWVRPTDWLAMPTIGTQEFIGLLAITDDESNHIALLCAGNYTVDWGDGVTENVATGVKAQHSYTYSAISSGTLSTRGYKQVLVRVTPQVGQYLTTVNLQQQNSIIAKAYGTGWLDISVNGANITTLTLGGSTVRQSLCERVSIGSIGTITNFTNFFSNFTSLQSIPLIFNTASGTTFTSMFANCYSLKTIPLINTGLGTTFTNMFLSCYSLQLVPLLNLASGQNFSFMFSGCSSLTSIPLFNTASGTNFNNMFSNCSSLITIPLVNTGLGTNFQQMFDGCRKLQSMPLLNTILGTNFSFMFNACNSLITVPLFNTIAGISFNFMFTSCYSLQLLPNLNTIAGTNFSDMLTDCFSLAKAAFQGTKYNISYPNMCLSQTEIVNIFNGLGTVVARTITISNNPGYAGLTAAERLIATNKGFTIA